MTFSSFIVTFVIPFLKCFKCVKFCAKTFTRLIAIDSTIDYSSSLSMRNTLTRRSERKRETRDNRGRTRCSALGTMTLERYFASHDVFIARGRKQRSRLARYSLARCELDNGAARHARSNCRSGFARRFRAQEWRVLITSTRTFSSCALRNWCAASRGTRLSENIHRSSQGPLLVSVAARFHQTRVRPRRQ